VSSFAGLDRMRGHHGWAGDRRLVSAVHLSPASPGDDRCLISHRDGPKLAAVASPYGGRGLIVRFVMYLKVVVGAAFFATTMIGAAHAAEWFVVAGEDRSCEVVDEVLPGFGKLAGPYATEEEAVAEQGRLARCEQANTDPDPDEDGRR
jgi:hypothetical protein